MPAVTKADLDNAKLDVDHIADIATSVSVTATDRFGNVKRTIVGWGIWIQDQFAIMWAASAAALLAARDAAAGSASAAAGSATTASTARDQSVAAKDVAVSSAAAAQNSQTAGLVGFANAAAMNANLNFADKTVAELFDTGEHYTKAGASGSGSWTGPNSAPSAASSLVVANRALDRREAIGRGVDVPNLFAASKATTGYYIQADGTLGVNAAFFVSDSMPVREGNIYTYSRAVAQRAWYNAAGALVGTVAAVAAGATEVAPTGAVTLRVSQSTASAFNLARLMIVPGTTLPALYQAGGVENSNSVKRSATVNARAAVRGMAPGGLNLFNKALTLDGYGMGANGAPYTSGGTATYFVAPAIETDPGATYTSNKSSGANGASQFDEDGLFLRTFTVTANTPFTMPADAFSYRQQVAVLANKDSMMVVAGSTLPAAYVAYASVGTLATDVAAAVAAVAAGATRLPVRPNLFDMRTTVDNKALSPVNGAEISGADYFYTAPILVTPGQSLWVTTHNTGTVAALFVWRNSSGGFVSSASLATDATVTVPDGAYQLLLSVSAIRRKYSLHVSLGTTRPAGYRSFGYSGDRPKQDAQVALLGDSFSDFTATNGGWTPYFIGLTGASIIANYAKAGRATRDALKTPDGTALDASSFAGVTDAIVELGTNDYGGSRALGAIADAADSYAGAGSFYNDVYVVLKTLYGWVPAMRVSWWTPTIRGNFTAQPQPVYPAANSVGATLPQYVQAIKDVCALFGTPVVDMFAKSGINLINLATLTVDNLHPSSPVGQTAYGQAAARIWNEI